MNKKQQIRRTQKTPRKTAAWLVFVTCLLVVYLVAGLGSLFTGRGVASQWYQSVRPAITPPDQIFGIVWMTLFFLIAVSLFLVWRSARTSRERQYIIEAFGINLILNMSWSALYFGLYNARAAFVDIILIWITIIWMMCVSWKINKTATYLLIPYLLWVSFASVLNWLSI